jgi:hypothetical protein
VHNVKIKHSAELELSTISEGLEKRETESLLVSLEENPFPLDVIKLIPDDSYAQICGRYYVTYIVIGDDVLVCSIKERPNSS